MGTHWVLAGTFLAAALLCLLMIPIARRVGLMDVPCARKTHPVATPLTGGIAMFFAFGIGVWLTGVLDDRFWSIMTGAALLVVIGLIDDRHNLDFRIRFLGQGIAAAFLVIGAGVRVDSLGNLLGFGDLDLGLLAIPFSIFAVVGMVNAINMLDGLDGLAGSITLVILGGIITLGVVADSVVVMPALILAAAVLGFLTLNFRFPWRPKARVFMGDAGSNFLGYCLAWFVIALPQHASATVAPVHVLWLVGFPVADTLATMWRRRRQGLSPFHAGHDHAHHWLRKAGVSARMTVLILVLTSFAYALTGVNGALYSSLPEPVFTYLFAVTLALMAMFLPRAGLLTRFFQRATGKEHVETPRDARVDASRGSLNVQTSFVECNERDHTNMPRWSLQSGKSLSSPAVDQSIVPSKCPDAPPRPRPKKTSPALSTASASGSRNRV